MHTAQRLTLHSNSIAHTVYSHFEPQKSLMTENDRDLNDRILGRNKKDRSPRIEVSGRFIYG